MDSYYYNYYPFISCQGQFIRSECSHNILGMDSSDLSIREASNLNARINLNTLHFCKSLTYSSCIMHTIVICRNSHKNSKMGPVASTCADDKTDLGSLRHWLKGHLLKSKT